MANRRRWECARCRGQFGIRAGTVLEGSPLPLKSWLQAIYQVLSHRDISVPELASVTGIRRLQTARKVALRIRKALDSDRATELLVGLDTLAQAGRGP